MRDAVGNLYGTATGGGAFGAGTVFKLTPNTTGKYEVLYSFTGGADGAYPWGGVIRDAAGNLYGTTNVGGPSYPANGVVFEVDTTGHEIVLYSFTRGADGAFPQAGLIRDAAGNLYGTTTNGGGNPNCSLGCGTVFELDASGKETVLHGFNGADGTSPLAGVIRDSAGNLYGTTVNGGAFGGGTVFKLDRTGKETVLHSFTYGADGGQPLAGLIRDAAGNLYGTAEAGGDFGYGIVFKLDSTGKETVLYSFTGGADGSLPQRRLDPERGW